MANTEILDSKSRNGPIWKQKERWEIQKLKRSLLSESESSHAVVLSKDFALDILSPASDENRLHNRKKFNDQDVKMYSDYIIRFVNLIKTLGILTS